MSADWPERQPELAAALRRGCEALELDTDERQRCLLLDYLQLLLKWNRAYNLTAVRDPAEMVTRHLLDSLAITPFLCGSRFLDVGTGAGLPGVPLAIQRPDLDFHLLDSNGKKARFLFQVKTALALDNMAVHHARAEAFRPEAPFDAVLSRAFASLADMVAVCGHTLAAGGRFLAMKGANPADELAALGPEITVIAVRPLQIPGLAEERHLVELAHAATAGGAQG